MQSCSPSAGKDIQVPGVKLGAEYLLLKNVKPIHITTVVPWFSNKMCSRSPFDFHNVQKPTCGFQYIVRKPEQLLLGLRCSSSKLFVD